MSSESQHVIEITGRVQMVGFRNFIEANAHSLGLGGIVFNDRDGSVKVLCEGPVKKVKALIRLLEVGSGDVGAGVESLKEKKIPFKIPLPPSFFKEPTVDLKNIKDELGIGIEILSEMNHKLSSLEKLDSMDGKLDGIGLTLTGMDGKLGKLDGIETTLVGMDNKLDRLDSMDGKLDGIGSTLSGMDNKLGKLDSMDSKLDRLDKLDSIDTTLVDIKKVLHKIAEK